MRRRRRRRQLGDVELNLAAMLDMAFQLLTFFILTFKPAPVEGQVLLKLPPPEAIATVQTDQQAGSDETNTDPVAGLNSLIISVFPNDTGGIGTLAIGEGTVPFSPPPDRLANLDERLKTVLADSETGFDQVIIQVGSDLRYDELMSVIDVCTRQTLANGEKLSKLSFVELPDAPAGGP